MVRLVKQKGTLGQASSHDGKGDEEYMMNFGAETSWKQTT
jgi:hypothetical protein